MDDGFSVGPSFTLVGLVSSGDDFSIGSGFTIGVLCVIERTEYLSAAAAATAGGLSFSVLSFPPDDSSSAIVVSLFDCLCSSLSLSLAMLSSFL